MRLYVGVTDSDWFKFLASRPDIDEVNFWQPGGLRRLRQISQGDFFLFKLHGRNGPIAGGGRFSYQTSFPLDHAWRLFGEKNGTSSLAEFHRLVARYRHAPLDLKEEFRVGCVMLSQPFFFEPDELIHDIPGWNPYITPGKYYDTDDKGDGQRLYEMAQMSLHGIPTVVSEGLSETEVRYGLHRIRDGQGIFSSKVTDAYGRRCAVTGERVLPVLEAAHIRAHAQSGPNIVQNGLLLRADIHKLFDGGYATLEGEPGEYQFRVSSSIRRIFENGQEYLNMNGRPLAQPKNPLEWPSPDFVRWHNEQFRG